jgi:hypothetical protein
MRPAPLFHGRTTILAVACVAAVAAVAVRGTARFMLDRVDDKPGASVVVPEVVGKSLCRAQRDLESKDLTVMRVTGRGSDLAELPATVVSQIPSAMEPYRDPEPIILKVLATTSVAKNASSGDGRRVHSRRAVLRAIESAGFPGAAVLRRGRPRRLFEFRSGVCEPVFVTVYRTRWGTAVLLQTVGQIVPQGHELQLPSGVAQRVANSLYWRREFYVLGVSPPNRHLVRAVRWRDVGASNLNF